MAEDLPNLSPVRAHNDTTQSAPSTVRDRDRAMRSAVSPTQRSAHDWILVPRAYTSIRRVLHHQEPINALMLRVCPLHARLYHIVRPRSLNQRKRTIQAAEQASIISPFRKTVALKHLGASAVGAYGSPSRGASL